MYILKRSFVLILAVLMLMGCFSTPAFAAETFTQVYDFEITPDMVDENGIIALSSTTVNNTFNVTGSHTGSTRTYYGNTLRYSVTITDSNGNAVDNILAIRTYESSGYMINESQFWADGALNIVNNNITSGNSYYFQYILAYGTSRTLKVHMIISSF